MYTDLIFLATKEKIFINTNYLRWEAGKRGWLKKNKPISNAMHFAHAALVLTKKKKKKISTHLHSFADKLGQDTCKQIPFFNTYLGATGVALTTCTV